MDLESTYNQFGAAVYRHALAITKNVADAEDVVQVVFTKLVTRSAWWMPVRDKQAYLHVATRREALRLRSRRHQEFPLGEFRLDEISDASLLAPVSKSDVDGKRIAAAIDRLPWEQREVFLLHVVEGETLARIARLVGISPNTVSSRYRYAKDKLREWLTDAT